MLRNLAAGILGAILGILVWLIAVLVIPLAWAFARTSLDNAGVGAFFVSFGTGSVAIVAIAGFGVGYYWSARRTKHRASGSTR